MLLHAQRQRRPDDKTHVLAVDLRHLFSHQGMAFEHARHTGHIRQQFGHAYLGGAVANVVSSVGRGADNGAAS
ncbi:MAG: hypothetical protein ACD_23C00780G0001, partial [uncultured bacterium]